jgi:two-component system, cell cycle sensor histidine kinase and response regulator CckA
VREHDGLLAVMEGSGGRGTRFDMVFPTAETMDDTQEAARPAGGARILVVDDDPDILDMMHRELQARSYVVEPANSPFAAQAAFINAGGDFDLLVTDVVMDGPSGIELARFLTDEKPRLRVLVVSGFIPEHEARIPAHWHSIPKPFTAEQLSTAVRRALTAHSEAPTVPPSARKKPQPI